MPQSAHQPKPLMPPRVAGYVLISVLIALALLTTVVFALQSQLLQARSEVSVERALGTRADHQERLLAAATSLVQAAEPVDLGGVWGLAISTNGLVDVNTAPPELVAAAFSAAQIPVPAFDAEPPAQPHTNIRSWFSAVGVSIEDQPKLAPFVTVQSGQTTVDPEAAAPGGERAFTSVVRALEQEALEESDTFLILMGIARDGPFTPVFYAGESDGSYMLVQFR